MKNKRAITEFSVQGGEIEEHFQNYDDAVEFLNDLTNEQQMDVQFFSKEWIKDNSNDGWNEGDVIIFKNKGEHI